MSHDRSTGIDAQGFILTVAVVPVQPEFQLLLDDVCATLTALEPGVDSIYLYGSVARGDATAGVSDLDLTLVLREPPTPNVLEQLEALRHALEQRHPQVSKIDFDIGHRAQVLAPENSNRWGFWLKHHCRCVWGDDLSLHFERFRPSREIALAINGDFEPVLTAYLAHIEHASPEHERHRLQREAARKLIRATHVVCAEGALTWPHTLEDHVAWFVEHYPTMRIQVAYFLFEARNPSAGRDQFATRLHTFLTWMVAQQAVSPAMT